MNSSSIGRAALLALALLVAGAARSSAQDRAYTFSEWTVLGAHALDAAATQRCLGAGTCRELNPWLARYDAPVNFTAAKVGVAWAQLWMTRKIRRTHPRLAMIVNYSVAGAFSAIAIRNERLGEK